MNRNRITAIVGALGVAGLVGVAAGTGAATAGSGQTPTAASQKAASSGVVAAATRVVTSCNGGANIHLYSKSSPDPFSFAGTSNALVNVPGALIQLNGPSTGTDTLLVTFSAETYYTGSGWMPLQVLIINVPMQPFANNGSPFAFASKPQYQSNSAQFCAKVGKGIKNIRVKVGTTGGPATDSGWLDDWTLSVQRFK
jgi:hypothetical protein